MMIAVKSYIMSVQWSEFPLTLASALLCGEQCAMLSGEAELTGHWTQLGWGDGAHAEISPAHSLPWLREVQSVGEEQLFQIFCAYLVYKYHADFIGIWEFHDGSWHRDMCRNLWRITPRTVWQHQSVMGIKLRGAAGKLLCSFEIIRYEMCRRLW